MYLGTKANVNSDPQVLAQARREQQAERRAVRHGEAEQPAQEAAPGHGVRRDGLRRGYAISAMRRRRGKDAAAVR